MVGVTNILSPVSNILLSRTRDSCIVSFAFSASNLFSVLFVYCSLLLPETLFCLPVFFPFLLFLFSLFFFPLGLELLATAYGDAKY